MPAVLLCTKACLSWLAPASYGMGLGVVLRLQRMTD